MFTDTDRLLSEMTDSLCDTKRVSPTTSPSPERRSEAAQQPPPVRRPVLTRAAKRAKLRAGNASRGNGGSRHLEDEMEAPTEAESGRTAAAWTTRGRKDAKIKGVGK
jgi:hypothetical protein